MNPTQLLMNYASGQSAMQMTGMQGRPYTNAQQSQPSTITQMSQLPQQQIHVQPNLSLQQQQQILLQRQQQLQQASSQQSYSVNSTPQQQQQQSTTFQVQQPQQQNRVMQNMQMQRMQPGPTSTTQPVPTPLLSTMTTANIGHYNTGTTLPPTVPESQYVLYEPQSGSESDDGGRDSKNRKRRRSRSKDRRRSRDRKHRSDRDRKKRRHRSRSRSRSRSRDRQTNNSAVTTLHIKPGFPKIGSSVSGLLEQVNQMEATIQRMQMEANEGGQRIMQLQMDLGKANTACAEKDKECTRLKNVVKVRDDNLNELRKNNQTMQSNLEALRSRVEKVEREKGDAVQRAKESDNKCALMSSEYDFLKKRNEVLLKKCEDLVEKQRFHEGQKEEVLRKMESLKRDSEMEKHHLAMKMDDFKRLEAELATAAHKERLYMRDRAEIDKKLADKEAQLRSERRQWESEKKRELETRQRLEARLREEHPDEDIVGIETVNRTMDILKHEMSEQYKQLKASIEPLKQQLHNQIAVLQAAQQQQKKVPGKQQENVGSGEATPTSAANGSATASESQQKILPAATKAGNRQETKQQTPKLASAATTPTHRETRSRVKVEVEES